MLLLLIKKNLVFHSIIPNLLLALNGARVIAGREEIRMVPLMKWRITVQKVVFILIVMFLLLPLAVSAQTIEDNYAAGGVQLTGNGYLSISGGNTTFYMSPGLRWFLDDNFSLRTGVSYSYHKWTEGSYNYFGLHFSPAYALLFNSQPESGTVIELDLYNTIEILPDVAYGIFPQITARYFLTPVIAPYINFSPVHVAFSGGFNADFRIDVGFGISYHIPIASKTLF